MTANNRYFLMANIILTLGFASLSNGVMAAETTFSSFLCKEAIEKCQVQGLTSDQAKTYYTTLQSCSAVPSDALQYCKSESEKS